MLFTESINESVNVDYQDAARVKELESLGFGAMDALHVVCAEKANVDVLLTTDDKFLQRAKMYSERIKIWIENPVIWLQEVAK